MKRRELFQLFTVAPIVPLATPWSRCKLAGGGCTGPAPLWVQRENMQASGYPAELWQHLPRDAATNEAMLCRCRRAMAYLTKPGCPACDRDTHAT